MAKNYFYNLLLTLANLLFPILSFPYVSRVLGPDGIGKVQFVFSFAQYFAAIAGFGIPIYGMKEIARLRDDKEARSSVFSELLSINIITSFFFGALYLATVYLFPYFNVNRDLYLAASLLILLGCSYTEWVFTGMEQFKSIAIRSVCFKFIGLLLMYLLIKKPADYRFYLYIMMFSFMGNNILSLFLLRGKVKLKFREQQIRRHLLPLMFILGSTIAASMYADADTILLGFLSNDKTVGLYTAAVKLSKISIPVITSMAVILIPKIAKEFADKNMPAVQHLLDQAFAFIIFMGVPITFGLICLAPEFIQLFSGERFLDATGSMRLLSVLPLIIGLAHMLLFMILIPSGRNLEMFLCILGGLLTSLILNFILIPPLKQIGSSIANVLSEVIVALLYFYAISRRYTFNYQWTLILRALISASVFFPAVWLIKELHLQLPVMLFVSVSGCAIAYAALQLFIFKNKLIFQVWDGIKLRLGKPNKQ